MKNIKAIIALFAIIVFAIGAVLADEIPVTPMPNMVYGTLKSVPRLSTIKLGAITWGGDAAAVLANQPNGIFAQHGLKVEIVHNDNLVKQTEAILAGDVHIARGTLGMLIMMDEALRAKGTHLVPLILITRSSRGDVIVVRGDKRLRDIRNVAVQFPGPHMYFVGKVIKDDGGNLSNVKFHWYTGLLMSGAQDNPVDGFIQHSNFDAVTCVLPDANALVGMKEAVEGARIALDTGDAKDVIFDLYAIRADVLEDNKATIGKLANALLQAQEKMYGLYQNKDVNVTEYSQVTTEAGNMMGLSSADITDLLSGCEFRFHEGNVAFFTGKGTTRNLEKVSAEIQQVFKPMGIVGSTWTMTNPNWDWGTLAQGLTKTASTQAASAPKAPTPQQEKRKQEVTQEVRRQVAANVKDIDDFNLVVETDDWADTKFTVEIFFDKEETTFPVEKYGPDFLKIAEYQQAYAGLIVTFEGHSDWRAIPANQEKMLKAGITKESPRWKQIMTKAHGLGMKLSEERGKQAREDYLSFVKSKGLNIDEENVTFVGVGYNDPRNTKTEEPRERAKERRVVVKLIKLDIE